MDKTIKDGALGSRISHEPKPNARSVKHLFNESSQSQSSLEKPPIGNIPNKNMTSSAIIMRPGSEKITIEPTPEKYELHDDLAKRIALALKYQLEFEKSLDEAIRKANRIEQLDIRTRKIHDLKYAMQNIPESELRKIRAVREKRDVEAHGNRRDVLREIMSNFEGKIVFISQCCSTLLSKQITEESDSRDLLLSLRKTTMICQKVLEEMTQSESNSSLDQLLATHNAVNTSTVFKPPKEASLQARFSEPSITLSDHNLTHRESTSSQNLTEDEFEEEADDIPDSVLPVFEQRKGSIAQVQTVMKRLSTLSMSIPQTVMNKVIPENEERPESEISTDIFEGQNEDDFNEEMKRVARNGMLPSLLIDSVLFDLGESTNVSSDGDEQDLKYLNDSPEPTPRIYRRKSLYKWLEARKEILSNASSAIKEQQKSEFLAMINQRWVPQNIMFYCHPLDLFKCSLPFDEVVESYLRQIQYLSLLELTEIGEKLELCTAHDVQKWFGKTKKNKFSLFTGKRRGSSETDEATSIFGLALEESTNNEKYSDSYTMKTPGKDNKVHILQPKVPAILARCADFIRAKGMDFQGIFRVAGSASKVRDLRSIAEKVDGKITKFPEWAQPHDVATLMKSFFRESKEPIFPQKFNKALLKTYEIQDQATRLQFTQYILFNLPRACFSTLYYLFNFLNEVAVKSETNAMTASNLAVVFAPNLIRVEAANDTNISSSISNLLEIPSILSSKFGSNNALDESNQYKKNSGIKKESKDAMQSYLANVDVVRFMIEHHKEIWTIPADLILKVE